jgi:hypothetical protein
MRSEKVSEALSTLQNRFMLCRIASLAVRGFHKPRTRIPDTMNEVLDKIAGTEPGTLLVKPERKKTQEPRWAQNDPQHATPKSKAKKRVTSLYAEVRSTLLRAEETRAKNRFVEGTRFRRSLNLDVHASTAGRRSLKIVAARPETAAPVPVALSSKQGRRQ